MQKQKNKETNDFVLSIRPCYYAHAHTRNRYDGLVTMFLKLLFNSQCVHVCNKTHTMHIHTNVYMTRTHICTHADLRRATKKDALKAGRNTSNEQYLRLKCTNTHTHTHTHAFT